MKFAWFGLHEQVFVEFSIVIASGFVCHSPMPA